MSYYTKIETPANTPPLSVGDKLKLDGPRRWTVRAHSANWTILTRQAPFKPAGELLYTVIDWRSEVRGPIDVSGHGYPITTDAECDKLLAELEAGEWSVSQRNWVSVSATTIGVPA